MKLNSIFLSLLSITALLSCSESKNDTATKENKTTAANLPKEENNISFENAVAENPNATVFTVSGNLTDGNDQKIYLYSFKTQKPEAIDSAVIDATGNYNLKGKGEGFQFYAVGSSPQKFKLLLLNSSEKVNINGDYNLISETIIEGSNDSKILDEYSKEQKNFYLKMQELQAKIKPLAQNSPGRTILIQQSEALTKKHTIYAQNFVDKNQGSPAILSAANDLFDPSTQLTYLKKIEQTLAQTMQNSVFHTSIKGSIAKVQQQQAQGSRKNGSVVIGQQAPDINLPSPTGGNIALSSLKGNVVLIDFWASWCKPCRMENPNVVRVFNQYKDKGFTIYSVSLDKDKARWVNAIQQDGLAWPNHVSDLKGWQSFAAGLYGVSGIPFTVLIDKNGKVIATNLRGIQLEQKLKEILG